MKTLAGRLSLFLLFFTLISCGNKAVITNRYMVDDFEIKCDNKVDFKDKTILIASVVQNPILRIGNIPYKLNSVKINYLVADKWASSVDDLIKRNLYTSLYSSKLFKEVQLSPTLVAPDYKLSVYIDYLGEEINGDDKNSLVVFDFKITDSHGETIYFETITQSEKMSINSKDENYVTELVQNLSKNIGLSFGKLFTNFYNKQS